MTIYRGAGSSAVADVLNVDGDYGDITVSNSGENWTINPEAVTLTKIQSISTDTLLGRASVGTGIVEEIPLTQVGRDLLDDVTVADQRTTLGLGTAATTASSDYATSAQGALADTAIQPADITDVVRDSDIVNMLETIDIGITVQAYDVDTAKYDDVTANFTGALQNGGSNVVVDTDIGATVLAYDPNLQSFISTFTLPTADSTNGFVLQTNGAGILQLAAPGGIPDGDKGDITVSAGGTIWNIDAGVVTTTELGGDITTAGKALLDDATAADQRATLGLGSLALQGAGDKGDITVAASGATWTVDASAITTAKIADSNVTQEKLANNVVGKGAAFSAVNTTNQSVTSGVVTKVTLDSELFDTNNNFASSRFTPTVAGYYQINGQVRGFSTTLTACAAYLYVNGSVYRQGGSITLAAINGGLTTTVSEVVYLNGTTDYVELYGVAVGGTPTFSASGGTNSAFSGVLVRAA